MTIAAVKPRKHRWGDPLNLSRDETVSGCDETHKRCLFCSVTKITVHPPQGYPFRVWMHANGQRFQMDRRPPCLNASETSPASAQGDSGDRPAPEQSRVNPTNTRNSQAGTVSGGRT